MPISWLLYTTHKTTQCVGFFAGTHKTKHNTDSPFLLRLRKKVSISALLFQKVCLDWKLFRIINRRASLNKNVLGGKKLEKLISGETSTRHSRVFMKCSLFLYVDLFGVFLELYLLP